MKLIKAEVGVKNQVFDYAKVVKSPGYYCCSKLSLKKYIS